MEAYLPISFLNDFIFCPRSIYFHQLHGRVSQKIYQQTPQTRGLAAHKTIENKSYSSSTSVLQGENSRHYTSMLLKAILHHKAPMFDYVQKYYRAFMRDKPIDDYPVFTEISCS